MSDFSPMSRRRHLSGLALLLLGGCGFRPVYGPKGSNAGAEEELSAIAVGIMPNRVGQQFRLALQDRFERGGVGVAQRYDLSVVFSMLGDAIGIQAGNTPSRVRVIGSASYVLTAQDSLRQTLKSGSARQVDGYNILSNQYFAGDIENDVVQRRIVEALADDITLQLATFFSQRATKG